jgi:hypothetical protein
MGWSPLGSALAIARVAAPIAALTACDSAPAVPDAPASAWRLGPAMPRPALAAGVALFGQRVVVAGGFDTGADQGSHITARVDGYDRVDQVWRSLPDAPVARARPALAAVGAALYLVGGFEGAALEARSDGYRLDPVAQQWLPIAAMDPGDARGAAGVVAAPGRLYLLGGASTREALASCLEYDVAGDRWTPLPALPSPRVSPAAMRASDGTLIVAGGFASRDGSQPLGDTWALPPPGAPERTWQLRPAIHPVGPPPDASAIDPRGDCAYGVVLGELVCAGGQSGAAARDTVDSYDPYTNTWTSREAMPVHRTGTQGAAAGGQLFVPGGAESAALAPSDTLYIYEPIDTAPRGTGTP